MPGLDKNLGEGLDVTTGHDKLHASKKNYLAEMANFSPVGGRVSQLQMCPRDFQNLGCPIFVVKHNLSFASLFHLVLEHFCLKPQETE